MKCLQLFYAYYIIGANLLDFRFGTEFFTIFLAPKFIKDSVPFVKDLVPFIKNSVPFIKVSVPFIKNSVPKFWHRNCIPPVVSASYVQLVLGLMYLPIPVLIDLRGI